MTVDLPEAVPQAALYQLDAIQEQRDYQVGTIRDLAAKIGINGSLYQMQERLRRTRLHLHRRQTTHRSGGLLSSLFFLLHRLRHVPAGRESGQRFVIREMTAKAEEFLKTRGLLRLPIQTIPSPTTMPTTAW